MKFCTTESNHFGLAANAGWQPPTTIIFYQQTPTHHPLFADGGLCPCLISFIQQPLSSSPYLPSCRFIRCLQWIKNSLYWLFGFSVVLKGEGTVIGCIFSQHPKLYKARGLIKFFFFNYAQVFTGVMLCWHQECEWGLGEFWMSINPLCPQHVPSSGRFCLSDLSWCQHIFRMPLWRTFSPLQGTHRMV